MTTVFFLHLVLTCCWAIYYPRRCPTNVIVPIPPSRSRCAGSVCNFTHTRVGTMKRMSLLASMEAVRLEIGPLLQSMTSYLCGTRPVSPRPTLAQQGTRRPSSTPPGDEPADVSPSSLCLCMCRACLPSHFLCRSPHSVCCWSWWPLMTRSLCLCCMSCQHIWETNGPHLEQRSRLSCGRDLEA